MYALSLLVPYDKISDIELLKGKDPCFRGFNPQSLVLTQDILAAGTHNEAVSFKAGQEGSIKLTQWVLSPT